MMPISFEHISTMPDGRKTHFWRTCTHTHNNHLCVEAIGIVARPCFCCEQSDSTWKNDARTRRCLSVRAARASHWRQRGPLVMTHVRWIHVGRGRESTDCKLMWIHCVGGWNAWPMDNCSWCDVIELAQSGSRVRFTREGDKRVMTSTAAVSERDPQDTCAQLIFVCTTTAVLHDEVGHVFNVGKDVTLTYSKSHQCTDSSYLESSSSSGFGARIGADRPWIVIEDGHSVHRREELCVIGTPTSPTANTTDRYEPPDLACNGLLKSALRVQCARSKAHDVLQLLAEEVPQRPSSFKLDTALRRMRGRGVRVLPPRFCNT